MTKQPAQNQLILNVIEIWFGQAKPCGTGIRIMINNVYLTYQGEVDKKLEFELLKKRVLVLKFISNNKKGSKTETDYLKTC